MTEVKWLACEDPNPMLEHLRDRANDRKPRLFGVACCRQVNRNFDPVARLLIDAVEQFADKAVGWQVVAAAEREVVAEFEASSWCFAGMSCSRALAKVGARDAASAAGYAHFVSEPEGFPNLLEAGDLTPEGVRQYHNACRVRDAAQMAIQSDLLRDIFGNPFRPATFSPSWSTDTTSSLAKQMYESRDFGAMAILADALQDAGCDDQDILDHCRGAGPHVRGCWVVDLVLGGA